MLKPLFLVIFGFLLCSASSAHADYQSDVLSLNPVAYFPMNENSGAVSAQDLGSGNNPAALTNTGSIGFAQPGAIRENGSRSYSFNSNISYGISGQTSSGVLSGKSVTIEAWVKTSTVTAQPWGAHILNRDAVGGGGSRLWQFRILPTGELQFIPFIGGTPRYITSSVPVNDGQWHHLIGQVTHSPLSNTSLARIYVDGVATAIPALSGSIPVSGTKVGIGAKSTMTGGWNYQGSLDEVAIYNQALPDADIQRHFSLGKAGIDYEYAVSETRVEQTTTASNPIIAPTITAGPSSGITYSFAPGQDIPSGLSISSSTGAIYGTPTNVGDGIHPEDVFITVRASKNGSHYQRTAYIVIYPEDRAQQFRPILRFDTDEQWRPLDVDKFLEENKHRLCSSDSSDPPIVECSPTFITSYPDLLAKSASLVNTNNQFIDVDGTDDDGDDYVGDVTCLSSESNLHDCAGGERSKIYVKRSLASETGQAYNYYTYWFYYRYNKFFSDFGVSSFNHEGDWEFVTIAFEPGSNEFAYATFSSHEGPPEGNINHGNPSWRYLSDALLCMDALNQETSCQSSSSQRVNVFVANGSHANYPQECEPMFACLQTNEGGSSIFPEKDFDGEFSWNNNNEPSSLIDINVGQWAGRWGFSAANSEGPASPSAQPYYNTPWINTCTIRWSESTCSESMSVFRSTEVEDLQKCSSWFGPSVVALLCDPSGLNDYGEPVGSHTNAVQQEIGKKRKIDFNISKKVTSKGIIAFRGEDNQIHVKRNIDNYSSVEVDRSSKTIIGKE